VNDSAKSKQGIVVFASSKQNGNTAKLLAAFNSIANFEVIDLSKLDISFFDYEHENIDDDFLPTINRLLNYKNIVFATPVYWYSMSAQMKVFFDRFSDLLSIKKELGRKIKGKNAFVLSTGFEEQPKRSFEEVFMNSFNYLEMNYKGMLYASCPQPFDAEANKEMILNFYEKHFRQA